ncbi:hypothetical protein CAEBREN_31252 [Caenorhabditis brenneri]|uniref:Uncharacterized protein n=1 Tax=Caenorhabditis brenneri TaxID=135651 RepID=G0NXY1_CAEBE|nr:hypothetical protein CAEBREN_31252 [Caenorhabditis brenneri]
MTEPAEEKKNLSSTTSQTTNIPDFELIVGGMDADGGSVTYEGEGSLQAAADCLRLMEDSVRDETDISELMEKFRRKTEKGELGGLSSTATTVSSSMASQWITHMKRTFKRHALALSEEQQLALKKLVNEILLNEGRLDEKMLENVALLGLNLAHLMGNMELFKNFEMMLQKIVH